MVESQKGELHVKFFPYQIMLEICALLVIAGILIYATNYPAHIGPQYDPMNPPSHLIPEWYFMPIYMVLKTGGLGAPIIGFMSLTGIIVGLMAMPFLDTSPSRHPLRRPKSTITGIFLAGELLTLWYLGEHIAPYELDAFDLGVISLAILGVAILFTHVTRTLYFRKGYLEEI